jgi:hypothetical protein
MIRLTSLHTAFGITLGILLGITASSVIAWSNPTATPPGGNVSGSPLTTGNWQTKLQGLVLNNSATPSALGLWVARGGVTIGTSSLPASFANQGLAVNGKVAAQEYCDENGENCSTPPFGGGGTVKAEWVDIPLDNTDLFDQNIAYRFLLKATDPSYIPEIYTMYPDYVADYSLNVGGKCGNIAIYNDTKHLWSQFDWNWGGCGSLLTSAYSVYKIQKLVAGVEGGSDTLASLSCSTDQIAKYNGSEWECAGDVSLGVEQSWVNVKDARALRRLSSHTAQYTNDTGRPIMVSVSVYSGASGNRCQSQLIIDGVSGIDMNFTNNASGAATCSSTAVVPPGSTYAASGEMSPPASATEASLTRWVELR